MLNPSGHANLIKSKLYITLVLSTIEPVALFMYFTLVFYFLELFSCLHRSVTIYHWNSKRNINNT